MIRIGIVGIGFMGMVHFLAAQKVKGGRVVAVHTRDRKKLAGDWRGVRGNFGPPGTMMDLTKVQRYQQFDDLLADPDIDLIDICTPTNLHEPMALAALKAGKHVLVEKAIALETRSADAMLKAAHKAGKLLMVAHVLPFVAPFAFAANAIRAGTYGRLVAAHLTRVISRPDWSADIGDASKTGGPAIDLHIHDTHFIGLVAGVPDRVFAGGRVAQDGSVEYLTTQYLYDEGGPAVTCSSGAVAASGRPFVHGFEIYLEKATMAYSSAGQPLTVYTADGKSRAPKLKGDIDPLSAFTAEIQTAVNGVGFGIEPDLLSGRLARDALALCHKECQSVRSGKAVSV
jgi:predicted dehydrogenase